MCRRQQETVDATPLYGISDGVYSIASQLIAETAPAFNHGEEGNDVTRIGAPALQERSLVSVLRSLLGQSMGMSARGRAPGPSRTPKTNLEHGGMAGECPALSALRPK